MATLKRGALLWVALVGLPAWVAAQSVTPDPPATASADVLSALQAAVTQLNEAEFETALTNARLVITALQTPPGTPRPQGEMRAKLARAYDLEAQCLFNLKRPQEMREAIERLLSLIPGYQFDRSTAGPPLVEEGDCGDGRVAMSAGLV